MQFHQKQQKPAIFTTEDVLRVERGTAASCELALIADKTSPHRPQLVSESRPTVHDAGILFRFAKTLPEPHRVLRERLHQRRMFGESFRDETDASRPRRLFAGRLRVAKVRSGKPPNSKTRFDQHHGVG